MYLKQIITIHSSIIWPGPYIQRPIRIEKKHQNTDFECFLRQSKTSLY